MTLRNDIGIDPQDSDKVAEALSGVLADTYLLLIKTHNFHWNVKGHDFSQLHVLFEDQYKELFESVDEIAERVRALGADAPGSLAGFSRLAWIKESEQAPPADGMIRQLMEDHSTISRRAREVLDLAAEIDDPATEDLMTQRIRSHDKQAWMLRAHLE
jgi:starvation-inducible DNA-binding protein